MLRLRAAGSGRGASVHPQAACVEQATRPEVLSRAFKRPVKLAEGQQLKQQLQSLQQQQLSIASRRKRL
jgi:predicted RNA-binding protein YlxR (DUF448 family)